MDRPAVLRRRRIPELLACPKARQDVPSASPSAEQGGGAARFFGLKLLIRLFGRTTSYPLRKVWVIVFQIDRRIFKPGANMHRSKSFFSWIPRVHFHWAGFALGTASLLLFPTEGFTEKKMIEEVRQPPPYEWTQFVKVAGQPEPVPVEWVSTPEGKFAHSIVIPNPVPADSGYKWWWSAKKYHEHLCATEAGDFIFESDKNVDGFLLLRPANGPTDYDLKDVRKLEAPSFENGFGRPHVGERASAFVWKGRYSYMEEAASATEPGRSGYFHASGPLVPPHFWVRDIVHTNSSKSGYGVTWRGIKRFKDREHAISGYEVIVVNLRSGEILGVSRDFGLTGSTKNVRNGIWWLNAVPCPQFSRTYTSAGKKHLIDFVMRVIQPSESVSIEVMK